MQNAPDTNTMNKKIKFLAKGAKFQAQAQKTSKVDWVSCFSKVLETFQAQMQILKSKPVE